MPDVDEAGLVAVAAEAERFTPADLRRVVEDAKSLFGADRIVGR